ncbi:M48 family metallopeptidase [Paenibacillus faecalis]|uniref:M48 family metallopeptidase n=1 Tax=Paenibacillus faecalis TaxID=2079532 RepID=UPI00131A6055|nr:M48 family metallopeptidase [Paenibacillus faecalis]
MIFAVQGYSFLPFDSIKRQERRELEANVKALQAKPIHLTRRWGRIASDLAIAGVASIGMILIVLLPVTSFLQFFALVGLIQVANNMMNRMIHFTTLHVYYTKESGHLFVMTDTLSRKIPLKDVQGVIRENRPDLLKLHPLFLFFGKNTDYTTNNGEVLALALPGETLYFTFDDSSTLASELIAHMPDSAKVESREVHPLFHQSNWKRLLAKGYFAVTVKGISAYSALFLLLHFLNVPEWMSVTAILLWWIVNVYLTDRLIGVMLDVREISKEDLDPSIRSVLEQAGLPRTKLFVTETQVNNAFATGMNVGRGMIVLTSSVMRFPMPVVAAIVAHEAVHVKKRDVPVGQIWRLLLFVLLVTAILLTADWFKTMDIQSTWITFGVIVLLLLAFGVLQSIVYQMMEVRADDIGSRYVPQTRRQMAKALRQLAQADLDDHRKMLSYRLSNGDNIDETSDINVKEREDNSVTKRDSWFWRWVEFQLSSHPPLYWRVWTLENRDPGSLTGAWRYWWKDRFRESLPDRKER